MSERELEVLRAFSALPEAAQERFLAELHGAAVALEAVRDHEKTAFVAGGLAVAAMADKMLKASAT